MLFISLLICEIVWEDLNINVVQSISVLIIFNFFLLFNPQSNRPSYFSVTKINSPKLKLGGLYSAHKIMIK